MNPTFKITMENGGVIEGEPGPPFSFYIWAVIWYTNSKVALFQAWPFGHRKWNCLVHAHVTHGNRSV